ncbi:SAP domain-containing protein [Viridibacillus sp. FSL H8-0110]|uniref:SAP domain-containing protein n=1 Tax=Viridibacillus sp. FSL H8-0110 TaxID=2921376 RepID=UPI00404851D2
MRPILSRDLNEKDFRNFYWLKEELLVFCRENGLSTSGSKVEITDRIVFFLQTLLLEYQILISFFGNHS